MKKIIPFLLIFVNGILIISCDEQVDPKTNFQEVYILNCVIRCDTSYQIATIARSYDVNGYNPNTNTNGTFLGGAKITLTYNSPYGVEVYHFRDTSIVREDSSRYKTPLHFYYLRNFRPEFSTNIKIEAVLSNGTKLTSTNKTIVVSPYDAAIFRRDNPKNITPELLSFKWGNLFSGRAYSLPEFHIKYKKNENGIWKEYVKLIPLYYSKGKNAGIPIYPAVQLNAGVVFDTLTIRKTLEDISSGDPNKQNYWIDKIVFMIHIMDENFATYYASRQTFNDEFSVRVTQPDFTNIGNGMGVFGVMNTVKTEVPFTLMSMSIGYRTN